jgi:hypothetical protein
MASKPKKAGKDKKTDSLDGLWIAPRYSLKGSQRERAWRIDPVVRPAAANIWN